MESIRGIFIYGYVSVDEARSNIKHIIRFLPPSGIEVWLTDAPGFYITGEGASAHLISEFIPAHCGCRELEPGVAGAGGMSRERGAPGKFLECIYSGIY